MSTGWLHVDERGDGAEIEHHLFVVMAGAGFDAAMMAGADTHTKRRFGQAAYVFAGARAVVRPPTLLHVTVDGQLILSDQAHGFVVGNCGTLTMGLRLMPEADLSDHELDAVVLLPHTFSDWLAIAWAWSAAAIGPTPSCPGSVAAS